MTIHPAACWLAPLIDGRYGLLYDGRHYTASAAALAAIIFADWRN